LKSSDLAVFIVEDDPSVSGALKRLMRSAGFSNVETFGSAEELLKDMVLVSDSLLILDVMLPGISGIELQQFVRTTGLSASTVFISANENELDKARRSCPEAKAYLLKPFGGEELLEVVRSVFHSRLPLKPV
jgi:FixJ family two-component response regulator